MKPASEIGKILADAVIENTLTRSCFCLVFHSADQKTIAFRDELLATSIYRKAKPHELFVMIGDHYGSVLPETICLAIIAAAEADDRVSLEAEKVSELRGLAHSKPESGSLTESLRPEKIGNEDAIKNVAAAIIEEAQADAEVQDEDDHNRSNFV
ncbi:MAG: hypothetical protein Q7V63_09545 [Gammaproteobacteria bacterium]|nr:hypothetical protein [Gammaproteobacteria bacterium]